MTDSDPVGALRLTIAGSSSSIPRASRACSGYLVEAGGARIVLDLGSGALANLRRYVAAEDIDAVVISHMHADHFLDVIPLRYALKYGPRNHDRKVRLCLPPGGEAMLRQLTSAFAPESPADFLGEVFAVETYDPAAGLRVGDASVRFGLTHHFIETYAARIEYDGSSLTYSADTAPSPGVSDLARDTDCFLCESTLLPEEREPGARGHISAAEAGALARAAGAKRLILTHYPAEADRSESILLAMSSFRDEVELADDHDRFSV